MIGREGQIEQYIQTTGDMARLASIMEACTDKCSSFLTGCDAIDGILIVRSIKDQWPIGNSKQNGWVMINLRKWRRIMEEL